MILNYLVLSLRFRDKSINGETHLSEAEMGGSKQSRILTQKIYIFLLLRLGQYHLLNLDMDNMLYDFIL